MANDQKNQPNPASTSSRSPADFEKVGPTSIDGVEASNLPDKGRGDVFTDLNKEAGRKLPQQTGQWGTEGDTGLKGDPDISDADEHGSN